MNEWINEWKYNIRNVNSDNDTKKITKNMKFIHEK